MRQQHALQGRGAQLDFFEFGPTDFDAPPVAPPSPKVRHPDGFYLIRSTSERGYWSNEDGWTHSPAGATALAPRHVCSALITQWRADGKPIKGTKGSWMWVARSGGLAGYRGADFDGPYGSEDAAREAALETLGPGRPLLTPIDAEYVLASQAEPFSLD